MNYKYLYYFPLLCCFAACETKTQETTEKAAAPDSSVKANATTTFTNQSELFRLILGKPSNNLFRELNLGDAVSKIKATETVFEMFEDSTNHLSYTHETDNFETIDVVYFLDKNQTISRIRVDVYLNNLKNTKTIYDQLDNYWSGNYAIPKKEGKALSWKTNNGVMIKLEDVSKNKDYGLQLNIGPPTKTPAVM